MTRNYKQNLTFPYIGALSMNLSNIIIKLSLNSSFQAHRIITEKFSVQLVLFSYFRLSFSLVPAALRYCRAPFDCCLFICIHIYVHDGLRD